MVEISCFVRHKERSITCVYSRLEEAKGGGEEEEMCVYVCMCVCVCVCVWMKKIGGS